jgi:hypothetical protein
MAVVEPRGWTKITVDGNSFQRMPVRTRWLSEKDDIGQVLVEYGGEVEPGDTIAISEKVALLLTGGAVSTTEVPVGWEARLMARCVHHRPGALGLSIPVKMQYVLQTLGRPRVYAAAAVAAVTRPLGIRGGFFRVAGDVARYVDGGLPPYEDMVFPPFDPRKAGELCTDLEERLGVGVAIVDMNDYGGAVRAVSPRAIPAATLLAALADNPMRQRLTGTPFAIVRPS